MSYSKGKWEVVHELNVEANHRGICSCGGYSDSQNPVATFDENIGNAHLVAAAVNACISVNQDNPQAVAEGIKEMYEALRAGAEGIRINPKGAELQFAIKAFLFLADKALAKVEGK